MKIKGLLLPIFSLPSKYGIGEFSKEAYRFIDILKENGFNTWQILPINPISYGHSPYQPYSSYAIEELLLSLDDLYNRGLISKPRSFREDKPHINYEKERVFKEPYYQKAFLKFSKSKDFSSIFEFKDKYPEIYSYCVFIAKKEINNNKTWNEWTKDEDITLEARINYHLFLQMLLFEEWFKIKEYANTNGISIIGDIPFYVGYDSSDVYFNRQCFLLDDKYKPTVVAGVSPDYFSSSGQRWGNPIYNFEYMTNDGYSFILNRINFSSKLYDYVRIDHFRAFDTYYVIPSQYKDAKIGEWKLAPGYEIFDNLFKLNKDIKIIAEDLGDLRPEVICLRDHYNLPGMNVLEFNIDQIRSGNIPMESTSNLITYIGTHDNETLNGYLYYQKMSYKTSLKKYFASLGINEKRLDDSYIAYTLKYFNNVILTPFDIIHLNNHGRINTPSTINDYNWTIKLTDFSKLKYQLKKEFYHND